MASLRVLSDTGRERIRTEKKGQRAKFLHLLSQGRKRAGWGEMHQAGEVRALGFYQVMGSCRAGCFSWAATCFDFISGCRVLSGRVWCILFVGFLEPLRLQGASSHFLVLRIKAHKTTRVSPALWGPGSSGKEGVKRRLMSY